MRREDKQTIITGGTMRGEEKQVMITWPTGHKDGPYTQVYEDFEGDVEVEIGDRTIIIPVEWTEEVEPELEEGRLYYRWDDDGMGRGVAERTPFESEWDNTEPVHRRWEEWEDEEIEEFIRALETYRDGWLNACAVMRVAYKHITREKHP